jgi:hypothetical protein
MAEQPQFPHDKGYKNLLSYKEIFLELLDKRIKKGELTGVFKTARRVLARGVAVEIIRLYRVSFGRD